MMGGRGVMLVAAFVDAAAVVDVAAVDVDDDSIAAASQFWLLFEK